MELNCLVGGCVFVVFDCVLLCVEWFKMELNCLVCVCVCVFFGCVWCSGWNQNL